MNSPVIYVADSWAYFKHTHTHTWPCELGFLILYYSNHCKHRQLCKYLSPHTHWTAPQVDVAGSAWHCQESCHTHRHVDSGGIGTNMVVVGAEERGCGGGGSRSPIHYATMNQVFHFRSVSQLQWSMHTNTGARSPSSTFSKHCCCRRHLQLWLQVNSEEWFFFYIVTELR